MAFRTLGRSVAYQGRGLARAGEDERVDRAAAFLVHFLVHQQGAHVEEGQRILLLPHAHCGLERSGITLQTRFYTYGIRGWGRVGGEGGGEHELS